MSKKEKLEKEKQKQLNMIKLAELDELEEKEAAKHKQSKAAKKYRRKAKKGYTNGLMVFFAILMTAAFCYSGVFYGGVTIVGSFESIAEFIPKKIAGIMAAGDILMLVGIILAFCKKYRLQAAFSLSGTAAFMYSAQFIISDIQSRMEKVYVDPSIADMDVSYMKYYYPILGVALFSIVIFTIAQIAAIKKKRRQKYERDTAPVKSIVG